jgi:hypothetical protein
VSLTPCPDTSAADWITHSTWPWQRLVSFGPEGFDAYARLRVVPDPQFAGQHESAIESTSPLSEVAQVGVAVAVLSGHTRSPDHCFVARWEGWPGDVAGFAVAALEECRFDVPNRSFFLFDGSLADVETWASGSAGTAYRPAFVWAADHAWCVAFDVDPHWAGIGATVAAIDDLRADPRLDVVVADPQVEQPAYW